LQFPIRELIQAGFNTNPLVLDIVDLIECRALQDMKWRARVKLPGGVFLIGVSGLDECLYVGVADESGTLKENEIFCQFQETEEMEPRVVSGQVLICRAPACELLLCLCRKLIWQYIQVRLAEFG